MHGFWPIFFLLVVLKVPVFSALWLVWWASRQTPETETAGEDSDGGSWRPPFHPRSRGPHGGGAPDGLRTGRRAPAAELVSDRRERVRQEGHAAPSHTV